MNFLHRHQPSFSWASEFDRLFDRGRLAPAFQQASRETLHESDNAWILRLDLPGYTKENVKLSVTDRTLQLVAETPADQPFGGKFERQWRLGNDLDAAGITASLENGVLELTIPKRPKEEPKQVNIEIR